MFELPEKILVRRWKESCEAIAMCALMLKFVEAFVLLMYITIVAPSELKTSMGDLVTLAIHVYGY